MHPYALSNTKETYDASGLARWNFCIYTKEQKANGEMVDSRHLPLFTLLCNKPLIRWGLCSGTWLACRRAIAWGWTKHEKQITPEGPKTPYYLRGRIMTGEDNPKKKTTSTHFLSFASEEMIPLWDDLNGIFNLHPILNIPEPLTPGNVWAFKSMISAATKSLDLTGESEHNNTRHIWINGPPIPNSNEDPDTEESPYETNRKLFYDLATKYQPVAVDPEKRQVPENEAKTGRIVYWKWE